MVSDSEKTRTTRRLFTVEEANARLPLVRAIASDLSSLAKDVMERRRRLNALLKGRRGSAGEAYTSELEEMAKSIDRDQLRLAEYIDELESLGVEAKGAEEGLVDFPSLFEGRIVYLCWRLGETEITHWHEIDAGFSGRQPLTVGATAESHGESLGRDEA